jgi:hypothetical protein
MWPRAHAHAGFSDISATSRHGLGFGQFVGLLTIMAKSEETLASEVRQIVSF